MSSSKELRPGPGELLFLILHKFWDFRGGPCPIGGFRNEFLLIRGGSQAIIVKPDFGELALTNRGGLINPVLTLLDVTS